MSLKHLWGIAGLFLGALITVGALTEFGRTRVTVFDGPITLPAVPESRNEDATVTVTPPFRIEGPTTLRVEQHQNTSPGVVAVGVTLIDRSTGALRQTYLTTAAALPGAESRRQDDALIDEIPSGNYVMRFDSRWQEIVAPVQGRTAPDVPDTAPSARIRAVQGAGTPWAFVLAVAAILGPPLVISAKRRWTHRARPKSVPVGPATVGIFLGGGF